MQATGQSKIVYLLSTLKKATGQSKIVYLLSTLKESDGTIKDSLFVVHAEGKRRDSQILFICCPR